MVTLHIPHFLVELEVVTLKGTDVRSEVCYDLILFSQFLRGGFPSEPAAAGGELNVLVTSSSSAFRCLNLSRWLVTMGRMYASAEFDANGIGVVRAGEP